MGQVADSIARAGEQTLHGFGMVGQALKESGDSQMQQASFLESQKRAAEIAEYRKSSLENDARRNDLTEQQINNQNTQAANTLLVQRQGQLLDFEAKQATAIKKLNESSGVALVNEATNNYASYSSFMDSRTDAAVGTAKTVRLPKEEYGRAMSTYRKTLIDMYGVDVGEQKLREENVTMEVLKSSVGFEISQDTLRKRSKEQINKLFENVRAQLSPTSPNLGYLEALQIDALNQWNNTQGTAVWGTDTRKAVLEGQEVMKLNKPSFNTPDPNAFSRGKLDPVLKNKIYNASISASAGASE